jgi:hypothetical protein
VDDAFLQRATATIPKRSIVLVEDIDCAQPSREDDDNSDAGSPVRRERPRQNGVTLSGLLNMIDGIGSKEGTVLRYGKPLHSIPRFAFVPKRSLQVAPSLDHAPDVFLFLSMQI